MRKITAKLLTLDASAQGLLVSRLQAAMQAQDLVDQGVWVGAAASQQVQDAILDIQAGLGLLASTPVAVAPVVAAPVVAAPVVAPAPSATVVLPNSKSLYGTNLTQIADYSTEYPFLDLMKTSRAPVSGNSLTGVWDDGQVLPHDASGYVTSLLPNQIARYIWDGPSFAAGQYVVTYQGAGTFTYGGCATLISSTPGKDTIALDPARGSFQMTITAINAATPPKGISIRPVGSDPYETFHPDFLASLRTYKVLRFMDWMLTNGSTQTTWAGRPLASDASYATKGVPVEVMVSLANKLGADAWFCMGHQMDDAYVTNIATYVRDNLVGKAYVEHSNECWNSQFAQAGFCQTKGLAQALGPDPFSCQLRFHSRRTVQVGALWKTVFGAASTRLVRVLGAQASNSWTIDEMTSFESGKLGMDAVAIAPYFGGDLGSGTNATRVCGLTVDQLFAELTSTWVPMAVTWMQNSKASAVKAGLQLVCYEGGQHLVGVGGNENLAVLNTLFDAVNGDPRMQTLYATYLGGWKALGAGPFVHFNNCQQWTKWGRWGARQSLRQSDATAYKFLALSQTLLSA